jgi:hypothetical protein
MVEAEDQHYISRLSGTDEHISEEAFVLTDVEECKPMIQSIFLDEKTDLVRWLRLKVAVLYVENLVEETAYVESKTVFFLYAERISILIIEDPTTL